MFRTLWVYWQHRKLIKELKEIKNKGIPIEGDQDKALLNFIKDYYK